jgi:hypothetical protein
MEARRWPTNGDYVGAVADLSWCFEDADLCGGEIKPSSVIGIPECATGQNAIVFPVQGVDATWAVRCFTTPAGDCERRYGALSEYVADLYCPPLVEAHWLTHGVRVDAEWWPAVKMRWADGPTLSEAIETMLGDGAALRALAERWREAVRQLRFAKIAHGDLQHGNVIIGDDGDIRFVDYDGVWVPAIADLPAREVGHPNYQHPQRTELRHWDEHIDTFAALVIYTSLHALAADPSLWDLHNGENLIFTAEDYRAPRDTQVWRRINACRDPQVELCAALLDRACAITVRVATDLDEILDTRKIVGAPYPPQWWDPESESRIAPESEPGLVRIGWGDWSDEDDQDDEGEAALADDDSDGDSDGDEDNSGINWRMVMLVALMFIAVVAVVIGAIAAHP